mmetsp:Transcript_14479/g.29701  ORF Transcript_14479/g.29701 Transcript_14479/m.29701 type:complete len:296 (-) Transcript_14479:792-1679(-)
MCAGESKPHCLALGGVLGVELKSSPPPPPPPPVILKSPSPSSKIPLSWLLKLLASLSPLSWLLKVLASLSPLSWLLKVLDDSFKSSPRPFCCLRFLCDFTRWYAASKSRSPASPLAAPMMAGTADAASAEEEFVEEPSSPSKPPVASAVEAREEPPSTEGGAGLVATVGEGVESASGVGRAETTGLLVGAWVGVKVRVTTAVTMLEESTPEALGMLAMRSALNCGDDRVFATASVKLLTLPRPAAPPLSSCKVTARVKDTSHDTPVRPRTPTNGAIKRVNRRCRCRRRRPNTSNT